MEVSIERVIKVGGDRWDIYVRLENFGKTYRIYIPLLPRKPDKVSIEVLDEKRAIIRLFSGDSGVCTCELDLARLEGAKCLNISCSLGATWVAEESLIKSHILGH